MMRRSHHLAPRSSMHGSHDEYAMTFPSAHSRGLARAATLGCVFPGLAAAQSLHGSRASIERMYHHARAEHFSFFATPSSVRRAVAGGYLVRLLPDSDF